jgi:hypothetical protein
MIAAAHKVKLTMKTLLKLTLEAYLATGPYLAIYRATLATEPYPP